MRDIGNTVWAFDGLRMWLPTALRRVVNFKGLQGFMQEAIRKVHEHGIEMIHFANAIVSHDPCRSSCRSHTRTSVGEVTGSGGCVLENALRYDRVAKSG